MEQNKVYSIPRLIMGIGHHLKMRMDEKLSQNNLTISQFRVLAYLWEHGKQNINQKMIHEFLEIKPSSLTKLIRLLQQKDLISKEADPNDSRNKIIKLTERGMEIKRICLKNIADSEAYLLQDFTRQEINTLTDFLLKIKEKIKH
ncbi:MAG: MarR family transcriptional regulator [Atribacterota bacterium]|nr:MarR family transcriptional regulator [Atribacterota bacterium]MDD4895652.1 MarR family transcriptional regulator [Atribacterota bacterium]MDD5637348.1 MarR family transcriptional regulator [Atribacterota bacterium]